MKKILVVDDEGEVRRAFVDVLKESGFVAVEASSGRSAVEVFGKERPDAVLLDLVMPGMDGIKTLKELKELDSQVPIIIVTGHANVDSAVRAIKEGAYDFIVKPPEVGRLLIMLNRAVEKLELRRAVERLNQAVGMSLEWLLGRSEGVKKVIGQISQVASSDFSVVIEGETGAGKTVVARAIHNLSKRANRPFVTVDMGAIPETLVESELFGHERGAFTGAEKKKRGFFEAANGGTILIDELQNMSPYVQSKLLSVIEERKIYPLGSTRAFDINVRVIAATNSDIRENVTEKRFREDLFFRLGEFIITLPPLRERVEDIPFLAEKFLMDAASELGKRVREISDDAVDLLIGNPWPGNVRELKNVIRRAVLLSDGDIITPKHIEFLLDDKTGSAGLSPLKEISAVASRDAEKRAIRQVMSISGGNKTKAANILQIDYKTLLTKIKDYKITWSQ